MTSPNARAWRLAPPTMPIAARPVLMLTRTAKPVVPPRRLHVTRILVDELEDAERRARGAFGIVLVRRRHAEVDADGVALVRLHGAAVLLGGEAHQRYAPTDERQDLVGREPLGECD